MTMTEPYRVEGNKLPPGLHLGCLFTVEAQCGEPDCESWRTIGIDCSITDEDGEEVEVLYAVCMNHVGEFFQERFFQGGGWVDPGPDCGNPDCPVHGDGGDDG